MAFADFWSPHWNLRFLMPLLHTVVIPGSENSDCIVFSANSLWMRNIYITQSNLVKILSLLKCLNSVSRVCRWWFCFSSFEWDRLRSHFISHCSLEKNYPLSHISTVSGSPLSSLLACAVLSYRTQCFNSRTHWWSPRKKEGREVLIRHQGNSEGRIRSKWRAIRKNGKLLTSPIPLPPPKKKQQPTPWRRQTTGGKGYTDA